MKNRLLPATLAALVLCACSLLGASERPRVIVITDGEVDDECSMVRFLLCANEFDVEGIITSSSQYHWQGHKWAGDDWVQPYLDSYAKVHPNLVKHDPRFPSAEFLRSRTLLGNVKAEGEMDELTPGAQRITEVLLDDSDPRPVWIQAWGGTNTIARALKTIEERHPEKMAAVARKIRFYFIWEQDNTYQNYIRPHWGRFGIPTIISDQFITFFYNWKTHLPADKQAYMVASWMKPHILEGHGPLCALYKAHKEGEKGFDAGDFRSEGDSPAFLHAIPTGLRSMESPDFGGWGGRFVRIRDNTWLDPVSEPGYTYPEGRWYTQSAWGRARMRKQIPNDAQLVAYLEPQSRWISALQHDFAARADWCVRDFKDANHPPVPQVAGPLDRTVRPGETVTLAASATDPDGNRLSFKWWQYADADSADSIVTIANADSPDRASFVVPNEPGRTLHIIFEVTDSGTPALTRYQRVVFTIEKCREIAPPAEREFARDIFRELIGINTVTASGDTGLAADAMAARLFAAGYGEADVHVFKPGPQKGNLVARLRGSSSRKPIMLLAHLDVVPARREDWSFDPFALTEREGWFYGRGTIDDKHMCAAFVATMIRLRMEGFRPDRDIILVLSTDEETRSPGGPYGIEWLLKNHRALIEAEFALNEGGGVSRKDGRVFANNFQTCEKTGWTVRIEVKNPGGHSSLPTKDNAIYRLAAGLGRLAAYEFPVRLNETTRAFFERTATMEAGPLAADLKAVTLPVPDPAAVARLSQVPFYNALLRTTAVATRLEAGHANNALPQTASATINCRLLPGETAEEVRQTLVRVLADEQIAVGAARVTETVPPSPLHPDLLAAIERMTSEFWPGVPVIPTMCTGGTDARFLRRAGIPTYGTDGFVTDLFDPRAHARDERIGVDDFYTGIEYSYRLVKLLTGGTPKAPESSSQ